MRRLASQTLGHGQKRSATLPSGESMLRQAASARQRPLRESYVALSDFFRANSQPAFGVTTGRLQVGALWQARADAQHGTSLLLQRRSFSSTQRWAEQQTLQKAVDHEQKRTDEDHGRLDSLEGTSHAQTASTAASGPSVPAPDVIDHVSSFPKSLRELAMSLPTASLRRPTKDELLASTSSFLERLRIRFKWFTIRGFRRFRADDWSAFVSWIVGGVGIWIVLGTTSFASALFFLANSLQMQEWMAAKLGSYLTASSGVTVIFESAIVPKFSWRDSRITFKNVYISRGMNSDQHADDVEAHVPVVQEGEDDQKSSRQHARRRGDSRVLRMSGEQMADIRSRDSFEDQQRRHHGQLQEEALLAKPQATTPQYTHFHFNVDSVEVALSLPRWLDGKGLVKEAKVKGVRGVIDRSHLTHSEADRLLDYRRFRHEAKPGDFQLESLQIEDFLSTIYQPNEFRPYTFSIFQANIGNLRKQWLFYDLLSAESITGQVDNCLYSLHKPQSMRTTSEHDAKDHTWKRMSRFRVDGVPIDHLQSSSDKGPLSWIMSGRADLVADIRFPRGPEDDIDLNTILGDIVDNLDEALRSGTSATAADGGDRIPGQRELSKGQPLEAPSVSLRTMLGINGDQDKEKKNRVVCMRMDIRFRDVKAAVPMFPDDLSSVNNALVRPIVAFLNANRTLIPIRCHVDIDLDEFDGSWTSYDIGLLDAVSEQVYSALANHVQESNAKRVRTVGLWSLQKSAATILLALKENLEHL